MDIKFHSNSERNFKNNQQFRAFLYSDYSIEAHNHDFYEINIILHGNGTHQIENSCFRVETGDVFMIPPMTVHSYYDTEDLDVYHILLHKDFIINNQKTTAELRKCEVLVRVRVPTVQNTLETFLFRLKGIPAGNVPSFEIASTRQSNK